MIKRIFLCAAGLFLLFLCSCATQTQYETQTLKVYVDRENLEKTPAADINAGMIDVKQLKKDRKLNIGVVLTLRDETQGAARLPADIRLEQTAYDLAQNYLSRVKAYDVTVLPPQMTEAKLMSGKEMDTIKYSFLLVMNVTLASEVEERYDFDEAMYKTAIEWKLVDNRTKYNDGELDAPKIIEALTCKNVTSRKLKIAGLTGRRMAGSDAKNAVNAYRNTLENALIEFRAQLANRLAFGGKVKSFKELDGEYKMTMAGGTDQGITKRMQMVIMNEDGDKIAIATANPGAKNTQLQIWRWLSPSLAKEVKANAGNTKSAAWMEEEGNALIAVCLGMPSPSKDERDQISDYK